MLKGLNINPRSPVSFNIHGIDDLSVDCVRFVLSAHASYESLDVAMRFYTPILSMLSSRGITSILVLNQETFSGWAWVDGRWTEYDLELTVKCEAIARWSAGYNVVYQIWNEGDIQGESSVYLPPNQYARVLKACVKGLKTGDPKAQIITMGLANSASESFKYIREVERVLKSKLPVNGIARHPYGQYLGDTRPNISTGWFGNLNKDFSIIKALGYPVWITEIGVSEPSGFPVNEYPAIANYLRSVFNYLGGFRDVKGCIWFAYHDSMRGAGLVDYSNKQKAYIYNAFKELPSQNKFVLTSYITKARLNVRTQPSLGSRVLEVTEKGEAVEPLGVFTTEQKASMDALLGDSTKWINIKTLKGTIGWVNAGWIEKKINPR